MDLDKVLAQLLAERDLLDHAIEVLERLERRMPRSSNRSQSRRRSDAAKDGAIVGSEHRP